MKLAAEAKKELDEKEKLLSAAAKELSDIRKAKANELSQTIMGQLEELDMPSVRFEPRSLRQSRLQPTERMILNSSSHRTKARSRSR